MDRIDLLEALATAVTALPRHRPVLVAIDGVDGAGKTTLAGELAAHIAQRGLACVHVSIDGFHRPRRARLARGSLDPVGYYEDSFDYTRLIAEFLEPATSADAPADVLSAMYDWKTESERNEHVEVGPGTIVLFEGVFLLRPKLKPYWDYTIFLDISPETSLTRGVLRDSAVRGGAGATRERYLERYLPGQQLYLSRHRPADHADAVIDNEDVAAPIIRFARDRMAPSHG